MPAEWEPHTATWMGFPYRTDTWHSQARPAQESFMAVARAIAEFEPVNLCVPPPLWDLVYNDVLASDPTLPIRVVEMEQNDGWFRDQAPTFAVTRAGSLVGVCWDFDAWGGLYSDWSKDALVGRKIAALERIAAARPAMVLEGGSIHVDGEGTLLTTESCLLRRNQFGRLRNPGMTRAGIEERLGSFLGVTKVLWLPRGVVKDLHTNEHVDNMACFLRPGVIALHWVTQEEDEAQHLVCQAAVEYLATQTDAQGRSLSIVKLPAPRTLLRTEEECVGIVGADGHHEGHAGEVLPGSYINFYLANGGVIVPQLGDDERDALALEILRGEFPDRRVVGVRSRQILCGGGNIHCITMQQPRECRC